MDEHILVKDELIGRNVRVVQCTDPTFVNKYGIIIDETKNTFLLEIDDKQIRIAKNSAVFKFEYNQKKITIKGSRLLYRPEDRTKKAR